MDNSSFDVAIIGGGVLGLSTAMFLSRDGGLRIVVLEAEDRLAAHQTGHNSGVIHAGLYYKPGSHKARLCAEGRELMYRFCEENQITHERCGKLVVATREKELPRLEDLHQRGIANGIAGIERLGPEQIREKEPYCAGIAGLWIPITGIVDYPAVCRAYARIIEECGGQIRLKSRLTACRADTKELALETTSGVVKASYVINCAGLQCDRVARLCGVDADVRIIPFRGEYYLLKPERNHLVRGLIYPVPDPELPFLGAHFTRMIGNKVEIGPNAVLAWKREGYRRRDVSLRDLWEMARFAGFWRMAWRWRRVAIDEQYRSLFKQAFMRAARRLVPEVRDEDVRPGGSGVRAQAVDRAGTLLNDFHFVYSERAVHVLNAPSPAATASIAIGREIGQRALDQFELGHGARRALAVP